MPKRSCCACVCWGCFLPIICTRDRRACIIEMYRSVVVYHFTGAVFLNWNSSPFVVWQTSAPRRAQPSRRRRLSPFSHPEVLFFGPGSGGGRGCLFSSPQSSPAFPYMMISPRSISMSYFSLFHSPPPSYLDLPPDGERRELLRSKASCFRFPSFK